jgi:ABC-type sugar transport system permease subunit
MTDRSIPVENRERLTGWLLLFPALVPLLLVFVYP